MLTAKYYNVSSDTVNVRRYNKQILKRKLRLASYISAPRLVKHKLLHQPIPTVQTPQAIKE